MIDGPVQALKDFYPVLYTSCATEDSRSEEGFKFFFELGSHVFSLIQICLCYGLKGILINSHQNTSRRGQTSGAFFRRAAPIHM